MNKYNFDEKLLNHLQNQLKVILNKSYPLIPIFGAQEKWENSKRGSWVLGFWIGLLKKIKENINYFKLEKELQFLVKINFEISNDSIFKYMNIHYSNMKYDFFDVVKPNFSQSFISYGQDMGGKYLNINEKKDRINIDPSHAIFSLFRDKKNAIVTNHFDFIIANMIKRSGEIINYVDIFKKDQEHFKLEQSNTYWPRAQAWGMLFLSEATCYDKIKYARFSTLACDFWWDKHNALIPQIDQVQKSDPSSSLIAAVSFYKLGHILNDRTMINRGSSIYQNIIDSSFIEDSNNRLIFRGCLYANNNKELQLYEMSYGYYFLTVCHLIKLNLLNPLNI